MIPFINKTDLVLKTALIESVTPVTPVKPVSDALKSPQDFSQGKRFLATVDTQLTNGNFKVLVGDQAVQMRLPENTRPGDKMALVLIEREPQLKFALQNKTLINTEKNPVALQNNALINTAKNSFASQNSTFLNTEKNTLNISPTGRFLGLLAQDSIKNTATHHVSSTSPILTNPPKNNVETPVLLQKALSQSGLFYESHQAQWINGGKTLAQLQQEPQGKLRATTTTASTAALLNADMPVNAQSVPIVQHQLTALDSNQILWRGEIWPEQIMDWEITEHTHDENEQDSEESPQQWQTQLHLTLPMLGEVIATLMFSAEDVRIKLHAPTTKTLELLQSNQLPLATALESAGLSIKALEIHADTEE